MRYHKINNNLFKKNRKKLGTLIEKDATIIMFSSEAKHRNGDQNYNYRQNSDFFYLTGIEQEKSVLIINKNIEILFILKPDKKTEIWEGKKLTKTEAKNISGLKKVLWADDLQRQLKNTIKQNSIIYYQKDNDNKSLRKTKSYTKKLNKNNNLIDISKLITQLRLIKEPEEIELIKQAISITKQAYITTLKNTKPNIKEYEIEADITHSFIKQGATDHAYAPIVAGGINACSLHYIKNDSLLKNGDLLLMDFGAEYANYAADLSRTIPINGKFTKRQRELYNAVLSIQKKAIKLYVPGNTINIINEEVIKLMEQEMINLKLFTKADLDNQNYETPLYSKYFMHGTSHFMGLDVHDVGTKNTKFKDNMVLTCEPGIYIEEEGIGIRIENDIIVNKKPIDLMENFPSEVNDIEKIMDN